MKINFKNKKILPYVILLIVTLIIGLPLLKTRMLNGDDSVFHLFRFNTLISAIKDGQLIPMVNPNMMGELGYAPNIFYGVLSSYVVGFLNLFLPSLGLSGNIFMLITIFLSGLFMYYFVKDISNNDKISILSAIIYMTNPYHLLDIYSRSAQGEIIAFVFMPLLFHGLYNIIHKDQKKWYLVTIGTAGLFLTHNLSVLMCGIFAFLYLMLNIKKLWTKAIISKLALSLTFALLISLITIVPLLEAKFLSDYIVFDINHMNTNSKYIMEHGINFFVWRGIHFKLNLFFIFHVALTLSVFIINRKNLKDNKKEFIILNIIALVLTLSIIPWNWGPGFLNAVQYPWRYLQYSSFFLSIIVAISLNKIVSKASLKKFIVICSLFIISTAPFIFNGFRNKGIDNNLLN